MVHTFGDCLDSSAKTVFHHSTSAWSKQQDTFASSEAEATCDAGPFLQNRFIVVHGSG